jgi:hypothetical protein
MDRSGASPEGLSMLGSGLARFQAGPPACHRAPWRLPGPHLHRQAITSFRALAAGHGRIEFFDTGYSRTLAWARRPQAAALAGAPDVVINEETDDGGDLDGLGYSRTGERLTPQP